jgi:hypothetical protein
MKYVEELKKNLNTSPNEISIKQKDRLFIIDAHSFLKKEMPITNSTNGISPKKRGRTTAVGLFEK